MADTRRSLSTLKTSNFADGQAAGSIDPQDMRDLIESFRPGTGRVYVSSATSTTIGTANAYVKAAGTTTADNLSLFDTNSVSNRLRYIGAANATVSAAVSMSTTTNKNNVTIGMALAKNGTVESQTIITRFAGTGAQVSTGVLFDMVTLSTNDYLEVFVTITDDTGTVTVESMDFQCVAYPA